MSYRLLCLALTLALAGLLAEAAGIEWQVIPGFGGWTEQGAWTPLFVDITNQGPSTSVRLTVPVRGRPCP